MAADTVGRVYGYQGKLEVDVSGTYKEVKFLQDTCTITRQPSEIDVTTRASAGYDEMAPGSTKVEIGFTLQRRVGDEAWPALFAAYKAKTAIKVRAADVVQSTVGADVLEAYMAVFDFSRGEVVNGLTTWTVKLKPTWNEAGASDAPVPVSEVLTPAP